MKPKLIYLVIWRHGGDQGGHTVPSKQNPDFPRKFQKFRFFKNFDFSDFSDFSENTEAGFWHPNHDFPDGIRKGSMSKLQSYISVFHCRDVMIVI